MDSKSDCLTSSSTDTAARNEEVPLPSPLSISEWLRDSSAVTLRLASRLLLSRRKAMHVNYDCAHDCVIRLASPISITRFIGIWNVFQELCQVASPLRWPGRQ